MNKHLMCFIEEKPNFVNFFVMTKGFSNSVIGPKFLKKTIKHVISREVLEHICIKREN